MITGTASYHFKRLKSMADWRLLLFLVLFLDVKLLVKAIAIVIIYLLHSDFKFGFSLKNSRLPLFYPAVIGIAIIDWLIGRDYGVNYSLVLLTGIGFWALCILAMHQVKLSVDNNDAETINRTIVLFFVLNALLSFINIAGIIYESGYLNPYTYQGQHQKYFIGTGDYIRGLTFDTSTTNAILNAFGVIYFLSKKNSAMLLLCMAVMLLTGSNFINILLSAILLAILTFKSSREQKSLISVCFMCLVLFAVKISPQNYTYVHETIKNNFFPQPIVKKSPVKALPYITLRPDSTLTPEERKEKTARYYLDSVFLAVHPNPSPKPPRYLIKTSTGRIIVPGVNIDAMPYQHIAETTAYQKQLLGYVDEHKAGLPLSGNEGAAPHKMGKEVASVQTISFLKKHPSKLIMGAGIGNFSSKLAFRVSGIGLAGGYPHQYAYTNADFLSNHLDLYLAFFSKKSDYHSLTNDPGSVYDQLLAEYGLLGVFCFLAGYVGYFLKHYRKLTYGIPLLILLLGVFMTDYWFEQLSVILFFELLMLLNIKENSTKPNPGYAN
ncbi:hypothetical protein [Mucilaginibacter ginsenosidivorans]|uniref:O-antigen ligase family protein n=1 Tax=Mucilaginibacter ginsenosidivorans TaxID=398053 RepID=A0A5B8UXA4_9SPHI|nr:hypothetical protein [Mucilaginibacter ginsenosidivorans]QEC63295.1 hypothetical protein FRZ54_12145 [Mucilaginibacter ginsenosidivorans]